jgi:hypothetical protein
MTNHNNNPYHSILLRQYFDISNNGVDYINKFGVKFEFKETFSEKNDFSRIIVKINKKQFRESNFIVICHHNDKSFFIHKTNILEAKYKTKSEYHLTSINLSSLRKNMYRKFNDLPCLKEFIDNLIIN